ncbi:MAG: SPOR domain-containing protein [Casimicrobiaceae bacterium]
MRRPSHDRSTAAPASRTPAPRHRGAGGTLLGVFIGLVLGLGLAAGVAYYLMRSGSPFPVTTGSREAPRDPPRLARTDKVDKADPAPDKPRFDFYKILPGAEEPRVAVEAKKSPDRVVAGEAKDKAAPKAAEKSPERLPDRAADKVGDKPADKLAAVGAAPATAAPKQGDRFWLQAGSFSTESDAENLKARLAMSGWQANVQSGTLPDKGIRYRVRLGPYDNTDELNRIRTDLSRNGFDVAVIKY